MRKRIIKYLLIIIGLIFATGNLNTCSADDISLGEFAPTGVNVATDASTLIPNIVTIVIIVAAALTFAYLIYGAISWITSGGDTSKVATARQRIISAVIGLLILASVWAIFNLVVTVAFGGSDVALPVLGS